MANPAFSSPINLNIPQSATGVPDELQPIFQQVFNALRTLQQAIGDATGGYADSITYTLSLDLKYSQSIQVQKMQIVVLPASVALTVGTFINIFDSGSGVMKFRKADASALATRAHGWVPNAIALGAKGIAFLLSGYDSTITGLTPGSTYYLSDTTPGGITVVKPVGSGKIIQEVGLALSTTELLTHFATPLVNP